MQPRKNATPPLEFKTAIRTLAQDLFTQLDNSQGILDKLGQIPQGTIHNMKKNVLLDPFVDANSGESIKVGVQIQNLLVENVNMHFKQFALLPLTPEKLAQSDYVMTGIIYLDEYQGGDKRYHVAASIFQSNTGKIIAQS